MLTPNPGSSVHKQAASADSVTNLLGTKDSFYICQLVEILKSSGKSSEPKLDASTLDSCTERTYWASNSKTYRYDYVKSLHGKNMERYNLIIQNHDHLL